MKQFVPITKYDETINIALDMKETYDKPVTFHCFWKGDLTEKHLYSILSCYYFNVFRNKHKIVLWLEQNTPNEYNLEIDKYAEIRPFHLKDEIKNTEFLPEHFYYNQSLPFYSDLVRYLLLYNYGGIWFDLDCFILRSFDPLFYRFEQEICVYQWEDEPYPNNAILMSLHSKSSKLKKNIEFILNKNRGWGFQEARLTYDSPIDMLVLPCSWFDYILITPPGSNYREEFFKSTKVYDLDLFLKGSFCFHWHNQWNIPVEENSIVIQFIQQIHAKMK